MRIKVSSLSDTGPVIKVWVVTYVSDTHADQFGSLIFGSKESAEAVANSMDNEDEDEEFYTTISCHEIEIG